MPFKFADAFRAVKSVRYSDAQRFAQHVVPEVVRPARVIWNQAIGAIFLLLSLLFLGNSYTYYRQMATDSKRTVAFGFSLFLGLLMGFFGTSSFLKARKIGRARPTRS
jgi:hypothetical protein